MKKALKTATVELKEELLWESKINFLENVWSEIKYELGAVQWSLDQFIDRVDKELENRKIDLRKFRNEKNEPITNMFKKLIRQICKSEGIQLSNDSLSRLLNYIRNQYSTDGVLTAGLFPVKAFFKRSKYGIPEDLGDEDSCFRVGGCNEGNALWFIFEDEKFNRANFVVFQYKSGSKEGWGRCWVYKVSDGAIFATNFYSRGFDIKSHSLKHSVVRILRKLADLNEVKFTHRNIDLPIYLNNDGIIIYEKSCYNESEEVIEEAKDIQSECMVCGISVKIRDLLRSERVFYYEQERVKGLIVCDECFDKLENSTVCAECGERFYRDDMIYHADRYWCKNCFYERFVPCEFCGEYFEPEDMIVDRYGNRLCSDCADERRRQCEVCNEYDYPEIVDVYKVLTYQCIEKKYVCKKCAKELRKMKCEKCGYEFFYIEKEYREDEKIREIVNAGLCPECYRSQRLSELCKCSFENTPDPLVEQILEQILAMENVIVQD